MNESARKAIEIELAYYQDNRYRHERWYNGDDKADVLAFLDKKIAELKKALENE